MKASNWQLRALINLIQDLSVQCSTDASYRDIKTIISRYTHEGLSFLTITLPNFADRFFESIELGYVASDHFLGWKKTGSYLPSFLKGFTKLVFDASTGRILDEPNINSIQAIRQIGFLYKKVKMPCTNQRISRSYKKYIATDIAIASEANELCQCDKDHFTSVADVAVNQLFHDFKVEELIFHHGPGATADKLKGNKKYTLSSLTFYTDWLNYFNESMFLSSEECYNQSCERPKYSTLNDACVRVIPVPKTQTKPRLIAMEPTAMQAVQQSIKDFMVSRIEKHVLTKGHINFSKQSINRQLALDSSVHRKYATLDLSDASDRVPFCHVHDMVRSNVVLQDMLFLSRTPNAYVEGNIHRLNKYASMGSATCFPIESLYFFIIILSRRLQKASLPVTVSNIYKMSRDVYVYGDDIIIPSDEVEDIVTYMRKFSCIVNRSKSYSMSRFRESCGMDAYAGKDVTPTYIRSFPMSKRDATGICSLVASANLLSSKGFELAANVLCQHVESIVGALPTVGRTCQGLGWTFERPCKSRYNVKLQRREVLTLVPSVIMHHDKLGDYNILYKSLLNLKRRDSNQEKPEYIPIWEWLANADTDLERLPRRGALTLKRRWVSPY